MSREQREVHFAGQVQGVGFRMTTRRTARGFTVTGFVQNLADGRVRLVAEGESAELDRFLSAVEQAMEGYIRDRQIETRAASDEFHDFRVQY